MVTHRHRQAAVDQRRLDTEPLRVGSGRLPKKGKPLGIDLNRQLTAISVNGDRSLFQGNPDHEPIPPAIQPERHSLDSRRQEKGRIQHQVIDSMFPRQAGAVVGQEIEHGTVAAAVRLPVAVVQPVDLVGRVVAGGTNGRGAVRLPAARAATAQMHPPPRKPVRIRRQTVLIVDQDPHGPLLGERLPHDPAIDVKVARPQQNRLPRQGDHPFHISLGGVVRILENGQLKPPRRPQVVQVLVNKQTVALPRRGGLTARLSTTVRANGQPGVPRLVPTKAVPGRAIGAGVRLVHARAAWEPSSQSARSKLPPQKCACRGRPGSKERRTPQEPAGSRVLQRRGVGVGPGHLPETRALEGPRRASLPAAGSGWESDPPRQGLPSEGLKREARDQSPSPLVEDGEEGVLRDLDVADLLHPLLAFLLLLQQLALAGDVAAVALGGDVLAEGRDRLAGDDLGADGGLDGDLELVAVDLRPELLDQLQAASIGLVAVDDDRTGRRPSRRRPGCRAGPGRRAGSRGLRSPSCRSRGSRS